MKICHNKPIRLDEIHPHWHNLYKGEEESNEDLFSVAEEWRGIQERLERVPFQMKLEIKEGLRLLAFSETTMLSPPPRKMPTKGAPKKIKTTPKTTRRIPSSWETIDSQHPESQSSPRKNLHNPKEKVLALTFLRFRFLSLAWFQEIMIHRVLCITCQNSRDRTLREL